MNSRISSVSHRSGQASLRTAKKDSLTQSNDGLSQPFSNHTIEDDTDDDDAMLVKDFDESEARQILSKFKDSCKVVLSQETQKEIGIEVGVNVTAEQPWKQVKRSIILDNLNDESYAIENLRNTLENSDMDFVLVGYIPTEYDKGDEFLFFENDDTARKASEIIEKLEALERLKCNKSIYKRCRPWKSLGSEKEVDYIVSRENKKSVDVDVQSIYKIDRHHVPFKQRMVADARDGYVELVQKRTVYKNLSRRRVDMPIQSATRRVTTEQQTDPTFPSDEWSQYLYEIEKNEKEQMATEAREEATRPKLKPGDPLPEPEKPSFQAKELLETLEFNEIDMYRNDYPYIAKKQLPKYKTPNLKEAFCFVQMAQSSGRYVCSITWNPKYSALFLASYTSNTLCTQINNSNNIDKIKRTVLQPCTVLLWSFDDIFEPQLQLSTPLEVTCLSFCPYDENLVIGGLVNGQLILWNMTDRLVDLEKELTARMNADMKKKSLRSFLGWGENNQFRIVQPVGLSSLITSQKAPITSIEWFGRKHYVETTGNIKENVDPNDEKENRFFLTTSLDGSIAFWDVDFSYGDKKKGVAILNEKYNANCGPVYTLVYNRPITGILFDKGVFKYQPEVISRNRKISTRVEHSIHQIHQEDFKNRLIVTTLTGELALLSWDLIEAIPQSKIPKGKIENPEMFANVHDGPIVSIARNPFLRNIFLTIGRQMLSLWHEEQTSSPIFWRYSPSHLTDCKWSKDKPSVFFVTTVDGNFEAWDILSRIDAPCLNESFGGSILTIISQHLLSLPKSAVAIGDYNSNVRILLIPETLSTPKENETEILRGFIESKVERQNSLNNWQEIFYNSNTDIREAKRKNLEQAKQEMERFEKELRDQEDERIKKEEEEMKREKLKCQNKAHYDFAEKLSRKWDEMNMKRMMNAVLAKKFIDPELLAQWSKPEKDRIAYNEKKQKAITESFNKINEDIVELRSRLLPVETDDYDRETTIRRNIEFLEKNGGADYKSLKENSLSNVNSFSFDQLDYLTILKLGRERRHIINNSLSSNNKHRPGFYIKKTNEIENLEIQTNGT